MKQLDVDSVVVRNDGQTMRQWFGGDVSGITVGDSIGADDMQGATDRWPVYQNGERVGTIFEDAHGTTYDAVDDDGNTIA